MYGNPLRGGSGWDKIPCIIVTFWTPGLGDAGIRDTIHSYLKKQWDENTKKIGEAIASAGVDLDWFSSHPLTTKDADRAPQTIIINAGNDAAINLGTGNIVKDAVVTGSTIKSTGGGGTTVKDFVVTKSTIKTNGCGGPEKGISISDSVITSSTIKTVQEVEPEKETVKELPPQPSRYMCLLCKTTTKPGAKFCTTCGAKIPWCVAVAALLSYPMLF